MRSRDALTDDSGVKWEFVYETEWYQDDGDPGNGADHKTRVVDFRYRQVAGEGEEISPWLTLPSWADVAEEWKITLCFFDEDEDENMTFWEVVERAAVPG